MLQSMAESRAHLRLLGTDESSADELQLPNLVRTVRRDMARLLRALQASGRGVTMWPDEVVTRLAHIDAVTLRYLLASELDEFEVRQSCIAMQALERWVLGGLSAGELAEVRAFELLIRIDDDDLEQPLLRPDGSPEEESPSLDTHDLLPPRSLRSGLRSLTDDELAVVARRLGLRPLPIEESIETPNRHTQELAILETLRDDHLLSILLATLNGPAHEILAKLVRGRARVGQSSMSWVSTVSGDLLTVSSSIEQLRICGLVFRTPLHGQDQLWVPVELLRRLDGVLRSFGV